MNNYKLIFDFDHTITTYEEKQNSLNSKNLIQFYMPKEFTEQVDLISKKYVDIEKITDKDYKDILYTKWVIEVNELYIKYKCTKTDIRNYVQKAVNKNKIVLRNFVKEIFEFCNILGIPILIFSSGLYDVIVEFLKIHKIYYPNVFVAANKFDWDQKDVATRIQSPIFYDYNKKFEFLKGFYCYPNFPTFPTFNQKFNFTKRNNLIVVTNSIYDKVMADSSKNIIYFGLNNNNKADFDIYFDYVINDNKSLEKLYKYIQNCYKKVDNTNIDFVSTLRL